MEEKHLPGDWFMKDLKVLSRNSPILLFFLYLVPVLSYTFFAFWKKPFVPVVWDSIFYKDLFWGMTTSDSFQLAKHFPVSPLYPLLLLPTAMLKGYLRIAQSQLALGAVYYFFGIIPVYRLGQRLGGKRTGLLAALLFVIYPSSIYSSWIMSEAVSVPIFLFVLWLSSEIMVRANGWNILALGLSCGLLMLSRPQGLFLAPAILLVVVIINSRDRQIFRAVLLSSGVAFLLAGTVWVSLGYISRNGLALAYFTGEHERPTLIAALFGTFFQVPLHACALWMEGGLILFPLGLLGGWCLLKDRRHRATSWLCLSVAILVLISVSFHVAKNMPAGSDQPILRYAFYSNLSLLPMSAWALLNGFRSPSTNQRFLTITILILSGMLLWPHLWKHMRDLEGYFANAPSLQVYVKMYDWPTTAVWAFLTAIGLSAAFLTLRYPRMGVTVTIVLVAIVTRHTLNQWRYIQKKKVNQFGLEGIHALCGHLERGDWKDMPVVCQYDPYVDFLGRTILFFIQSHEVKLAPDYDGKRPYLFVTFQILPDEPLVMSSGGLKAYLMEGPDKGPPPSNYTPGPPPWY